MKRQRIEKHESLIHQVINEYLIREGKSFLGKEFVTIMGIKLSADLSVALVFISVLDNSKSEFVVGRAGLFGDRAKLCCTKMRLTYCFRSSFINCPNWRS